MLYSCWYSCACCRCKAKLTTFLGPCISVKLLGLQVCLEVLLKMQDNIVHISMDKDWFCWVVMNLKEIILENWWQISWRNLYVNKPWAGKYKRNKHNYEIIPVSCDKQSNREAQENFHDCGMILIQPLLRWPFSSRKGQWAKWPWWEGGNVKWV